MIDFDVYAKVFAEKGEPLEFGTPVTWSEVKRVGDNLRLLIEGQYAEFLTKVGGLAVFNSWINGVYKKDSLTIAAGNVNGDTLRMRERGLPSKYIVVRTSDDEFAFCLDSSIHLESPVYGVEIPFAGSVEKIAANFNCYIKESLVETIKVIDEDR